MKAPKPEALAPFEQQARLLTASQLLQQGRRSEAVAVLRVLAAMVPRLMDAHRLLGVALSETSDLPGAETAFRAALKLAPGEARVATGLAEVLLGLKRGPEAVTLLRPFVNDQTSNLTLLTYYGLALQAAERPAEAAEVLGRAAVSAPTNAIAEHNLAGALVDDRRYPEAESAASRARAKGLDVPELWLVEARAARGQGRLDEAETLYGEALKRRPFYSLAAVELAQTVWMARADLQGAVGVLDEALIHQPLDTDLLRHRAKLLEESGDRLGAYDTLARALAVEDDAIVHIFAAQVAVHLDAEKALEHATHALALQPRQRRRLRGPLSGEPRPRAPGRGRHDRRRTLSPIAGGPVFLGPHGHGLAHAGRSSLSPPVRL